MLYTDLTLKSTTYERGSHLIGTYSNLDEELDDALLFLRPALDNNERIILIIDERLDRNVVYERIEKEWNLNIDTISNIEDKGDLIIVTSPEWYLPNGIRTSMDKESIQQLWANVVMDSRRKGKAAVRVFANTDSLFRLGMDKEFLKYESILPLDFGFPMIALCAYQASSLSSCLTPEEIRTFFSCDSLILMDDHHSIIKDPPTNEHIALLYESENERDMLISDYLNEGLKRGQLCAYATVMNLDDRVAMNRLRSRVIDFDNAVKKGDLMLINLASHYVAALSRDLEPFAEMEDDLIQHAKMRRDRHVRVVADCAGLLYQNRHFEECANLEEWWHQKPFEGSYLCPYEKRLCDRFPYDYNKYKVFGNHDIVIDERGSLIGSYIPHSALSINSILHLPSPAA